MLIVLGLLLGAASVAYMAFPQHKIGFAFPNINQEYTIRPTFHRLTVYLLSRWLGYCTLGVFGSWAGMYVSSSLAHRLASGGGILLALFMFLFLATHDSPELPLARRMDPARRDLPIAALGWISALTLTAPVLIGLMKGFAYQNFFFSIVLFTNIFLGASLMQLPILLNMKWSKEKIYISGLRILYFACAIIGLVSSILDFIQF